MIGLERDILYESIKYALPEKRVYHDCIDVSRVWDDCQFFPYPVKTKQYLDGDSINLSKTDPEEISHYQNTRCVQYMLQHHLNPPTFSGNPHPDAVDFFIAHEHLIDWRHFSRNPSDKAIDFLFQHPLCIDWHYFSINPSDRALQYWMDHHDDIIWDWFSGNENIKAIQYMMKYPYHVNWFALSQNLSIKKNVLDMELIDEWIQLIN